MSDSAADFGVPLRQSARTLLLRFHKIQQSTTGVFVRCLKKLGYSGTGFTHSNGVVDVIEKLIKAFK